MTGPQEVWFISGFDSYEAMEHSAEPVARNAALTAELNRLLPIWCRNRAPFLRIIVTISAGTRP
jgi:hypothetical protein